MIFFANAEGNITKVIPEPVYQNSHNANEIVLVAPFSKASVGVAFTLPNGVKTALNFAEPNMSQVDLTDIVNVNGEHYNAWRCLINNTVTEYVGEVSVQFYIYNGYVNETQNLELEILTTYKTTFSVLKGVRYIPPKIVDDGNGITLIDQIMGYLSELESAFAESTIVSTEPLYPNGIKLPVTVRADRTAYVQLPVYEGETADVTVEEV